MKKLLKTLCIVLASIVSFSAVGCGGPSNGDNGGGESGKSILYMYFLNAGFGTRWITAAAERFEEYYANTSFEEGKMGVDVVLDPSSSNPSADDVGTSRAHIFFPEVFNISEFVANDVMENVTAAMTTSLGESYGVDANGNPIPGYAGETKSIYEKMTEEEKSYFVLSENGQQVMYCAPYMDSWNGSLSYDADVFEKYKLYYKADNTMGATKGIGKATTVALGLGPDGVQGTNDDGLPRTYDEFFAVCEKMQAACSTTPFVWCGNWTPYVKEFAFNLFAQNIGYDQYYQMFKGEGFINDYITNIDSLAYNGGKINYTISDTPVAFNSANYKEFYKSAGLLNSVDFIYQIINNNYVNKKNSFSSGYTHETAQSDFFFGKENNDTDFGFLVDGTWWYNEAEKNILKYEERVGSRMDRNVRFMTVPKADLATWERTKGQNTIYTQYNSSIVIKKGLSPQMKTLAETFLRFFCTDQSLVEYNTIVSVPRGLNYTMTDEQFNALNPYSKDLYAIKNQIADKGYGTYKVVHSRSHEDFYRSNATRFKDGIYTSQTAHGTLSDIAVAFNDYISKGLDGIKYYKGILTSVGA